MRASVAMVGAVALVLPALAALPPAAGQAEPPEGAGTGGGDAAAALAWLAAEHGLHPDDASLSLLAAEAAQANGLDVSRWPAADPVGPRLTVPDSSSLGDLLRPAFVLGLLHGPDTNDTTPQRLLSFHDGTQFGDAGLVNDDIWAVRALVAWGVPPTNSAVASSIRFILAAQGADGGWAWAVGGGDASVDVTGMALVTLRAASALPDGAAARAAGFLSRQHVEDGYRESDRGAANCDSTVWAIHGLAATGSPAPPAAWAFLARLQRHDGAVAYRSEAGSEGAANALCTAEATTLWGDAVGGRVAGAGQDASSASGSERGGWGGPSGMVEWIAVGAAAGGAVAAAVGLANLTRGARRRRRSR